MTEYIAVFTVLAELKTGITTENVGFSFMDVF
jgi:hypothetical protein